MNYAVRRLALLYPGSFESALSQRRFVILCTVLAIKSNFLQIVY